MSGQAPSPIWPPAVPTPAPVPPPRRPRYSRFAAIVLSFISPSLYRDVARNWRGIGFLYLLLLVVLSWVPVFAKWHFAARGFAYGGSAESALREFPTITINNGVVSIAEEEPYAWRDRATGEVLLYVDTSGEFADPDAVKAKVLLSRSTVEVRNNPRETRVYDLSDVKYFFVDKHKVLGWVQKFSDRLVVFGLPMALLASMLWALARLLVCGLVGLIFASIFNARLDFAALLRLAAVAATPSVVLDTLAWTFNFGWGPCCAWSVLMAIIELTYVGFAVKVNADPGPPPGVYMAPHAFPTHPAQYPGPQQPPSYPPAR